MGPERPNRSLSIQCSAEGSVECGTYAHGEVFHDSALSHSVDSGMVSVRNVGHASFYVIGASAFADSAIPPGNIEPLDLC